MSKTILLAGALAVSATAALPASEAPPVVSPVATPGEIAREFIGHCLQNPGDYERVVSTAEALEFERIPKELDALTAPQNPYEDFEQYRAHTKQGAKYLLATSRSRMDGAPMVSCSVAFRDLDVEALASDLADFAGLGAPQHSFTERGQNYRIWMPIPGIEGAQIIIVDGTPMQITEGSIGLLAPERR